MLCLVFCIAVLWLVKRLNVWLEIKQAALRLRSLGTVLEGCGTRTQQVNSLIHIHSGLFCKHIGSSQALCIVSEPLPHLSLTLGNCWYRVAPASCQLRWLVHCGKASFKFQDLPGVLASPIRKTNFHIKHFVEPRASRLCVLLSSIEPSFWRT